MDDSFLSAASSLLDRAFDGWPRLDLTVPPIDHLRWKLSAPVPDWPAALIAEAEGKLIAYRTVLVRHIAIRDRRALFVHFVDAAVDPDWQGRGVGSALQDVMQHDFQPRFDLSIDDSQNERILRSRTRLGNIHAFGNRIRPFALAIDPARLFDRDRSARIPGGLAVTGSRLLAASLRAASALRRTGRSGEVVTLETMTSADDEFDRFTELANADFEFIPERSSRFVNWRYADPRAGRFVLRAARNDGVLVGYAATKVGPESANIVDILTLPAHQDAAFTLAADSLALAREAGAAVISCWLPERHPHVPALRALGFAAMRRTTPLMFRAVSMPESKLSFLHGRRARIHLTHGDTDMV